MKIRRTVSVWQKDVLNRLKMLYDILANGVFVVGGVKKRCYISL